MSHNNQKKIAVINDLSGFGRCSLTVAMPIISHMGIQCCPVPTSIFSNHTGFKDFFFDDYTDKMQDYVDQWKKMKLEFEGIFSGFLGSERQINIVKQFIIDFKTERTKVIVDPVMGDNGVAYATYNAEMCKEMKRLVEYADILTPNVTEACILTDTEFRATGWSEEELVMMAESLSNSGPSKVVITGIRQGNYIANLVYEKNKPVKMVKTHLAGEERSGTGDVFSSIIAADEINGVEFYDSVKKASSFVKKAIEKSIKLNIPRTDGVCFEEVLKNLR